MEQPEGEINELQLRISIAAAPAIAFVAENNPASTLPGFSTPGVDDSFRINLEAAVPYESMSRILNGLLARRRFDISEGLIPVYVVVEKAAVNADAAGNLLIQVHFNGSFKGAVYFKGKPAYDGATQTIDMAGMAYKLQSESILLNTAKWLFSNKIAGELKKHARLPLAPYLATAKAALHGWLNKEWTQGISGAGSVGDLTLNEIAALPGYLSIKSHCDGKMVIKVAGLSLGNS